MLEIIRQKFPDLEALCRRHRVQTLEVFGSAMDGTFDRSRSDLDFLVEFLPEPVRPSLGAYFDLRDDLESLFHRKVDLVMLRAIRNRYLLEAINHQRKLLYAA